MGVNEARIKFYNQTLSTPKGLRGAESLLWSQRWDEKKRTRRSQTGGIDRSSALKLYLWRTLKDV